MKHYTHYQPEEEGKSDFYSWNLFRWLRNQDKEGWIKKTNIYKTEDGQLYIGARYQGRNDEVIGCNLRTLCSDSGGGRSPLVGPFMGSKYWKDVTDWFWPEYERIGVCAIHGYFAHDFEVTDSGDCRICKHCEQAQIKTVKMVEKVCWEKEE